MEIRDIYTVCMYTFFYGKFTRAVRMETAVRIETPVKIEMNMQDDQDQWSTLKYK